LLVLLFHISLVSLSVQSFVFIYLLYTKRQLVVLM